MRTKEQQRRYAEAHYAKHGDKIRAKNRERSRNLPPETRRRYMLKHRYGISMETYDAMMEEQQGACAICGDEPKKERLVVDHDHSTGALRGLLCRRCNMSLVLFDDLGLYMAALAYLERE